jgi:ribosomal protein S12 methylthiotransferase accessory factor
MPEVDLDSIEDPYTDQLLAFYRDMDRDLRLLDVTSDLGIPSFVAVSRRLGHPVEDPLIGFGAHVEPRLGALRALTECNQFLPSIVERDANGNTKYGFDDGDMLDWFSKATFESEPYLVPDAGRPVSDVRTMNNLTNLDISEEISSCVEVLRKKGLEVFVLDQSRPDLDIKVAKVIVPGLRHFWRRLGEGRLYDVPVEMGLLDVPCSESDLNPKSIFF